LNRRSLLIVAAAAVLLAAAITIASKLIETELDGPRPTDGQAATSPSVTSTLETWRPSDGSSSAGDDAEAAVLAASWFTRSVTFAAQDEIDNVTFRTGRLDGTVTHESTVDLGGLNASSGFSGALPFAAGPFDGDVLIGYYDGAESSLRLVSADDGHVEEVVRSQDVIHMAVVDRAAARILFLALDADTRAEKGIWAVTPGGVPQRILPARESPSASEIVTRMFISPDGDRLVTFDCRDGTCRLRGYALPALEQLFDVAAPDADPIGITAREFVISGSQSSGVSTCAELPCPLLAFDLESGQLRGFGRICRAAVVEVADEPVVIADTNLPGLCGDDPRLYSVMAFSLESGNEIGHVQRVASDQLVATNADQGFALPAGWVLLAPDGHLATRDAEPTAVEWRTHRELYLPPVPAVRSGP
jgi:hypothetical protein